VHRNIDIIDLGICNSASVVRSFQRLGVKCTLVSTVKSTTGSPIVLPGVGHSGYLRHQLCLTELDEYLKRRAQQGEPILGICAGMQVLFECSQEGEYKGLGLIKGGVIDLGATQGYSGAIPNVGWAKVTASYSSVTDVCLDQYVFFCHKFHCVPTRASDVVMSSSIGKFEIVAGILSDNVFGVQFHPEKSQGPGFALFTSWLKSL